MRIGAAPDPPGARRKRRGERVAWLAIAAVMFVVYARSFSGYPVIERVGSVVGEADGAAYLILWKGFRLGRPLGDPYALQGRTQYDVAEKHRLHHPVGAAAGYVLARVFTPIYRALGLTEREAPFAVSALWGALNIVLVGLLLYRWNPPGHPIWPFLVLYGVSLSPWLYASVPDSWALTATLFLVYLLLVLSPRISAPAVAAALGVFMLNNMTLGAAILFLWLPRWERTPPLGAFLRRAALLTGLTIATWAGCLMLLSLADPGFRLDRFLAYSAWFRQFIGADLPLWSAYVWKSMLSNLFVTSLVSNQPDANMPQEALLYTLQGSWLGRIAVLGVLGLFTVGAVRGLALLRDRRARGAAATQVLLHPAMAPLWFCLVMIAVTYVLYYPSGFTYAALVLPMLMLLLHRFLDFRRLPDRVLVLAALTAVVVNNAAQVALFRATLAGLG